MSRMVDERVVEIKFNNRDFERNARQTLSTLDQLHSGLNFKDQAKNLTTLGNATKKVSFSVLENGIQKVNAQFSAMQIAGITALSNIANSAVNSGKQLVKSLSIDQITAGYSKYEEKTASVQTIMSATGKSIEEVSAALEKLNWFTDETSYNFVDMTNNIGKFTSAGVDLDVSVTAMEGIATAAALAGQNASTASRVMYNFSQALGTGAVKLQDWMSIENANMATLEFKQTVIDTAVELGVLEKAGSSFKIAGTDIEVTAKNFRETLSKNWFTSDVLLNTLQKYGDYSERVYEVATEQGITCSEAMAQMSDETVTLGERAFKAAQEAKTFTDAINATKDAVSTGWMTTFETLFGNYVEAKDTWTELANRLYDIFAESGNTRNELLGDAMGSRVSLFEKQLTDAGYSVEHFRALVYESTQKAGIDIQEMFQKYGFYTDEFVNSEELSKIIDDAIMSMADDSQQAAVDQSKLNEYLETYNKLLSDVAGKKITDEQAAKTAEKLGISMDNLNDEVEWFIESGYDATKTFEDLTDEQLKSIGYTKSEIDSLKRLSSGFTLTTESAKGLVDSLKKPTGRELLIDSLRDALVGLQQLLNVVKNAWAEVFPSLTADRIYTIIECFKSFTENLVLNEENADKLKRTFKGVFSIIDIGAQIIKSLVQNGFNLLKEVLGLTNIDLLDFTAGIGDAITGFDEFLKRTDGVNQFFTYLIDLIKTGYGYIKQFIDEILQLPQVQGAISTVKSAFSDFIEFIGVDTSSASKTFENILNNFKALNDITFDDVKGAFKEFSADVEDLAPDINIVESLETATTGVKAWGEETIGQIKSTFQGAETETTSGIQKFAAAVKETISNIDFGAVGLAAVGIALLLFTNSLIKNINSLLKTLTPLKEIVKTFVDTISGIGKTIKRSIQGLTLVAELIGVSVAVFLIASAVSKLAEAITYLAKADPENVVVLVAALAGLVVVSLVLTLALARLTKTVKAELVSSYTTVLIGLAVALVATAVAMRLLTDIPFEQLIVGFSGLFISLVALAGGIYILTLFGKSMSELAAAKVVGVMLGLASSIALLSASLRLLSGLSFSEILEELGGAVISLIGIAFAAKMIGAGEGTIGSILSIAGIIIAFKMLTDLIADFDPKFLTIVRSNIGVFVIIVAGLVVLSKFLSKGIENTAKALNETAKYAARIGLMIIEIAAAILILTQAVKAMVKVSKDNSWQDLAKGGVVVGALLGFMALLESLGKRSGKYALRVGGMILMMAGAIAALSLIIAALGRVDEKVLDKGTGVIASLLAIFAGILQIAKFEKSTQNGYKSLWALMTTLGVVLVGVGILGQLSKDGAKIPEIIVTIAGLFIAIGNALKNMAAVSGSLDLGRLVAQIIVISGVVALISSLLVVLTSQYDQAGVESSINAAASISLVLYAMAKAIEVINEVGNEPIDSEKLTSLLLMVTGLSTLSLLLGMAVTALTDPTNGIFKGGFNVEGILVVIGSVGLLLAEIAGLYYLLNKLFEDSEGIDEDVLDNLKFMAGITSVLTLLMAALALVNINISEALSGAAGVGLLLVELGLSTWLFAKLPNKKIVKNARDSLWLMVAIMSVLTALIFGLSFIKDGKNAILGATAVAELLVVLGGMTAAMLAISKIPAGNITQAIIVLAAMAAVAAVCGLILIEVRDIDGEKAIKQVEALALLMGTIAVLAVVCAGVGALMTVAFAPALVGLATLLILTAVMGAVLWSIGNLVNDVENNNFTKGAALIGEVIGSFVGGIVDGFGNYAVDNLVKIAQAIADFSNNIEAINTEKLDLFYKSVEAINTLSKTKTSKLDKKIKDIDGIMTPYGKAIRKYADSISDLTEEDLTRIQTSIDATQLLVDIANNLPKAGGLWQDLAGDTDFGKFIGEVDEETGESSLSKFGTAIVKFAENIKNLNYDEGKVNQVSDVALTLAGIQSAFKPVGGIEAALFGEAQDWDTLAEGLPSFGKAVVAFCESIGTLTDNDVKNVGEVVPLIKGLAKMIDALGDIDLKNLPETAEKFTGVYEESWGVSKPVFTKIRSVWAILTEGLSEFVTEFTNAADLAKNLDNTRTNALDKFIKYANDTVDVLEGFGKNYSSNAAYNWDTLTTNIGYLADAIEATATAVTNVADHKVDASNFYSFITSIINTFKDLPSSALTNLTNFNTELKNFGDGIVDSASWSTSFDIESYADVGRNIMVGLITGMEGYMDELGETGAEAGETVLEGTKKSTDTRSPSRKMIAIGRWLDIGLANGVINNLNVVKTAAEEMGSVAENALRDRVGVHSESTLFNEIGTWCGPGFASGLESGWGIVKDKLSSLGSSVVSALGIDADALKNTVTNIVNGTGLSFDSLSTALGVNADAFDLSNFNFDDFSSQLTALTGNVDSLTFSLNASSDALDKVKERLNSREIELANAQVELQKVKDEMANMPSYWDPIEGKRKYRVTAEQGRRLDFWTKEVDTITAAIARDQELQAQLESDNASYKDMLEEAKNSLSSFNDAYGGMASEAYKQALDSGNAAMDKLIEKFEAGKVSASDFSKSYQDVLNTYQIAASEIIPHALEGMTEAITSRLDTAASNLQDRIEDIKDKMDEVTENYGKTYEDTVTFYTNKDIYDKKTNDYNKQIEVTTAKLNQAKRQYGETSVQAQQYQKTLDELNQTLEAYEDYYKAEGFDDDQVVKVDFGQTEEDTAKLKKFNDQLETLVTSRHISDDLRDFIAGLDQTQAESFVDTLSKMSDDEIKAIQDKLDKHNKEAQRTADLLYSDKISESVDKYGEEVQTIMDQLSPEFKSVGAAMILAMENGFDEEMEKMLDKVGLSGDEIIATLKDTYAKYANPAIVQTESTLDLGSEIATTFSNAITSIGDTGVLKNNLASALGLAGKNGEPPELLNKFNEIATAVQNGVFTDEFLHPKITPVLDLSQAKKDASELDTMMSYSSASKADYSLSSGRTDMATTNFSGRQNGGQSFVVNQSITSPEPVNAADAYMATKRAMQLMNVLSWR